jgi:pimeloyl-ACP methyl ester carboxylesterase
LRRHAPPRLSSVPAVASPTAPAFRYNACVPLDLLSEIEEPAALALAAAVSVVDVYVTPLSCTVPTALVHKHGFATGSATPPIVLLHGFDSSLLEFRRLVPLLEQSLPTGTPLLVPDLLGCGFTGDAGGVSVSPEARRAHLRSLLQLLFESKPVVLVGASLGGACAVDFALHHPELVCGLVLVDAQAYTEGIPQLPGFLTDIGLDVLRSVWLRDSANKMAYHDKAQYAHSDALRVGRLHTFAPSWKRSLKSWMRSGGYTVAARVAEVSARTLVVWGREDEILEPSNAGRFQAELPVCAGVVWIERCGHCPHLEQPAVLTEAIIDFTCALLDGA